MATGQRVSDLELQVQFENLWDRPTELRALVPDAMLRVTRAMSVVCGSLIAAILALTAYRIGGIAAAIIAPVMFLGDTFVSCYLQRGLGDGLLIFHVLAILPASYWAATVLLRHWRNLSTPDSPVRWIRLLTATILVPGLIAALAAGTKLNGGLALLAYGGGLLLAAAVAPVNEPIWRRLALVVAVLLGASVVAAALFVAVNPYYYHHPGQRLIETIRTCRDWVIAMQIRPGTGLFPWHQRVAAIGYFCMRSPMMPLVKCLGTVGQWIVALGFVLGLIGLPAAFLPVRQPSTLNSRALRTAAWAMAAGSWTIVVLLGTSLWLPLLWDRYLLLPYAAVCLIVAIGLAHLPAACRAVVHVLRTKTHRQGSPRTIALASLVVISWVLLGPTDLVVNVALLNPMSLECGSESVRCRRYAAAAQGQPGSTIIRHNYGLALMDRREYTQAAIEIEAARLLLGDRAEDPITVSVQRCCLLHDLAEARLRSGDLPGAADALRGHIAEVQRIEDRIRPRDERVRTEFSRIVAERRGYLAQPAPRTLEPTGSHSQ
ncbi:MAG: hypothetical protein JXQ73_31530 [Phycisphaerae bacterium]|nr:hypothetical protein [Phycisphaerae bacterium]